MIMICEFCGVESVGRFCSKVCYKKWHYRVHYQKELVCGLCGSSYLGYVKTIKPVCFRCRGKQLPHAYGSDSPHWKGGHRYWSPGRHGRDKDGLSWKVQRQLVWKRDYYTCKGCGKKKEGWHPDVHHKIPYRISHSHALDNLICLCKSCHKKKDCQEQASGSIPPVTVRPAKPRCRGCGSGRRRLDSDGWCAPCHLWQETIPKAKTLRDQGLTYREIAQQMGVQHKTVWDWLNGVVQRV